MMLVQVSPRLWMSHSLMILGHTFWRTDPRITRVSASDASTSLSSSVDVTLADDLGAHILENRPKDNEDNVPLGATVIVYFNKDVRTVNINKLFEVGLCVCVCECVCV